MMSISSWCLLGWRAQMVYAIFGQSHERDAQGSSRQKQQGGWHPTVSCTRAGARKEKWDLRKKNHRDTRGAQREACGAALAAGRWYGRTSAGSAELHVMMLQRRKVDAVTIDPRKW